MRIHYFKTDTIPAAHIRRLSLGKRMKKEVLVVFDQLKKEKPLCAMSRFGMW